MHRLRPTCYKPLPQRSRRASRMRSNLMSRWAWPGLAAMLLLLCAASAAAQDVDASHRNRNRNRCSSSAQCSSGSTCECTCRSRHGSAAAASSSDDVIAATHGGGSWLQPGDACSLKRTSGQAWARCRPGSFCACSCVAGIPAGIPVGGNDSFAFTDPEGPEGPGTVTVSVLGNDASPDGSPVIIAPGSVESLTPGVTVVSVDEEAGIIDIDIPNDTQNVLLRYTPAGSGGLGAQVVVAGTPMAAYPTGACVAGTGCGSRAPKLCKNSRNLQCKFTTGGATCASVKFGKQGTYCMANFKANCASTVNAGCNRCAIYQVMQSCKAYNPGTNGYPKPGQSPAQACRYYSKSGNYVIVKSRSPDPKQTGTAADPETGSNLCLMPKHYILMPTAVCTGVDDNSAQCTGAASKAFWDGAVRHGYGSGAGDLGFGSSDWAVMINAPDERGQHQMHIHVAPLVPATSSNILIAAKQATNMQTVLTKDPTVITAGGHTVAAYFFKEGSTPPKVAVDVYGTAAAIHIKYARLKSLNANDVAYGVALIPKPGGFVVAATYGFADVNVMDTTIANSPVARFCQAACAPFK
uniref:Uncharacterized protein n=1 Tax=Tetradesmus obliquus TaxID=3088 RepID=A0A383VAN4_TETOB|eukprot:jgi/Sobl393_1/16610/SZX61674.1